MKRKSPPLNVLVIAFFFCFLSSIIFVTTSFAQNKTSDGIEPATCFITRSVMPSVQTANTTKSNNGKYEMKANQIGYFNQVSGIDPIEKLAIEVHYPKGDEGERIIISVEDGGNLENGRKLKVMQLDHQKRIAFTFETAADAGMYRILVSKGKDTKVIQLWVGSEPQSTKMTKNN